MFIFYNILSHSIQYLDLENVYLDTKTCLYDGYNPRYSHFKEKTAAILKIKDGGQGGLEKNANIGCVTIDILLNNPFLGRFKLLHVTDDSAVTRYLWQWHFYFLFRFVLRKHVLELEQNYCLGLSNVGDGITNYLVSLIMVFEKFTIQDRW